MYKRNKIVKTSIHRNESQEGETIEQKIERIVNNKEPITDGAPIVYTERKNGVEAQYNIRTDRFEVAIDAMTAVDKAHQAKRAQKIEERETIKLGNKEQNNQNKEGKEGGA